MNLMRNYTRTTYSDGRVEVFDPLVCWHLQKMRPGWLGEIGLRKGWAVGFMLGFRVGDYSTYRTKFIEIGGLTLYVHAGKCAPHNPRERK